MVGVSTRVFAIPYRGDMYRDVNCIHMNSKLVDDEGGRDVIYKINMVDKRRVLVRGNLDLGCLEP